MRQRNKSTLEYVDSPLNRSKSKQAYSFGKRERFEEEKKRSPDKFYDLPDTLDRRATTLGFGKKVDFVKKDTVDPAKYHIKSEFEDKSKGYTFSLSREAYDRGRSYANLLGPGAYNITKDEFKDKSRKTSPLPKNDVSNDDQQNKHNRSYQNLQNQVRNRKSSAQLKTEYSHSNILAKCNKPSYTDFLLSSKDKERRRNRNSPTTFGLEQRLKMRIERPQLGPGSFNAFSQFGYSGK